MTIGPASSRGRPAARVLVAAAVVACASVATAVERSTASPSVVPVAAGMTSATAEVVVFGGPVSVPEGLPHDSKVAATTADVEMTDEPVVTEAPAPDPQPAAVERPLGRPGDVPGRTVDSPMPLLDLHELAATAERTGVPERALAAYASAALLLREEQPSCRVTWVTLAGVGDVESHHGTIGGRALSAEGWPSEPIVGVPLDGGPNVRAIRDTDGGRYDGDPVWDRAVGPMQFIPSTWARWGADGNGDGVADPQQIDDAALAAARYLCASGGDLTVASSWGQAMFSYNRSDDYVRHVLRVANTYADRANAG